MTNIVVLIKQVPDTWSERKLSDGEFELSGELPTSSMILVTAIRRLLSSLAGPA